MEKRVMVKKPFVRKCALYGVSWTHGKAPMFDAVDDKVRGKFFQTLQEAEAAYEGLMAVGYDVVLEVRLLYRHERDAKEER